VGEIDLIWKICFGLLGVFPGIEALVPSKQGYPDGIAELTKHQVRKFGKSYMDFINNGVGTSARIADKTLRNFFSSE
jgi:hypothetical protein